eukprot:2215714-Rhodomonas_salina.1
MNRRASSAPSLPLSALCLGDCTPPRLACASTCPCPQSYPHPLSGWHSHTPSPLTPSPLTVTPLPLTGHRRPSLVHHSLPLR